MTTQRSILVTGATSQIGLGLARALTHRGDRVRCLVRTPRRLDALNALPVEQIQGDITRAHTLAAAVEGMDAVIHVAGLASYWKPRAEEVHRINTSGTRNLLDAAIQARVRRFVLTSSVVTLGFVEGNGIGDENAPQRTYGIPYYDSKLAAEQLVFAADAIEAVAVNPGMIIGGEDLKGNGGKILHPMSRGRIKAVPPGAITACVATDVISGHIAALDRGRPGERYVLGGTTGTYLELMSRISAVVGCKPPKRVLPARLMELAGLAMEGKAALNKKDPSLTRQMARTMCRNRRFSSQKAIDELGYAPSPIEEGVEACMRWYGLR